jgi:SAM-dependent methyltransferase
LIRKFIRANQRLCDRIEPHLPQTRPNVGARFEETVVREMNRRPGVRIVDVGAGKRCPYAEYRDAAMQPHIIGVDVSEAELRQNRDVDEYRVADATGRLPFADGEADLLLSLNTLEHISPMAAFADEGLRVLKPGGLFIHLFSSRWAPFAILNRLLPHSVARRILYFLYAESQEGSGFRAYYDQCTAGAIRRLLTAHGFEVELVEVSYYQSPYFRFFVSFYLISAGYELLIRALGLSNLAAQLLVVARKPGPPENS